MKYFLQIEGNETGPFTTDELRAMLADGKISFATLGLPENQTGEWRSIDNFPEIIAKLVNAAMAASDYQVEEILYKESSFENSRVASALSLIAMIELVLSPIVGLAVGLNAPFAGLAVFICGSIGALILLGFSRVIEHSNESAHRLRRMESILLEISAALPGQSTKSKS